MQTHPEGSPCHSDVVPGREDRTAPSSLRHLRGDKVLWQSTMQGSAKHHLGVVKVFAARGPSPCIYKSCWLGSGWGETPRGPAPSLAHVSSLFQLRVGMAATQYPVCRNEFPLWVSHGSREVQVMPWPGCMHRLPGSHPAQLSSTAQAPWEHFVLQPLPQLVLLHHLV